MAYVVYNKFTTRFLCRHPNVKTDKERFATYGAAQATITREAKRGAINPVEFLIADSDIFHASIELTEAGTSAKDGTPVQVKANTPYCCDPRFERYWSM